MSVVRRSPRSWSIAAAPILDRDVRPTPARDQEATLQAMEASARAVVTPGVAAIGISAAGLVEAGTGIMRYAPEPVVARRAAGGSDRRHVRRADRRRQRQQRGGVGRVSGSAGARPRDTCCSWGSAPGSAAGSSPTARCSEGRTGSRRRSGTPSWSPDGPLCGCGNHGCWEQVASGSAIMRDARAAVSPASAFAAGGAQRRRSRARDRSDGDRGGPAGRYGLPRHPRRGRAPVWARASPAW